jgi:DNA-binding NarL/FixJ family response regulator
MEKIVTIVLVENHILVRSGIRSLLAGFGNFKIIGETELDDCVTSIQTLQPDVAIVDIRCYDSFYRSNLVSEILHFCPMTHVLIITDSANDKHVMDAFRQGALGCLLASSKTDELYQSIISLSEGGSYLPPAVGKKLIQGYNHTSREKSQNAHALSAQQLQVLRFISQGFTNQDIADNLVISKRTVEMHAYKIFKKLNVTNRTQAIQVALRSGLIDAYDWSTTPTSVDVQED